MAALDPGDPGFGPAGYPVSVAGPPGAGARQIAGQLVAIRLRGDRVALTVQALLIARDGRRAGEVVGCLVDLIHRRTRIGEQNRTVHFEVPNFGLGGLLVRAASEYVTAVANRRVRTQRAILEDWESADLSARQRLYLMATVIFLLTAVAANRVPAGPAIAD